MNVEKQAKKFIKGAKSNWTKAKRTYICRTLKELIKAYRACTTKSEERALVKKEAAHIRDLFREGDKAFRRRNIAKLLFFHMNGYPTDFGMTECIKLCASNKYNDKRVAYLGLMILVDETEEVLMLMTNCLKQDLHSDEMQIVSLALNVLGDIASVEMVRDLLPEIEKHLLSQNPYIRKKAALAAVRAVRKLAPEETVNILHDVPVVFDIKSPAVHISATALVSALCRQQSANLAELQITVAPALLHILRDHLLKKGRGSGTEPVIGGVRNPFLQVKVIASLRLLVQSGAPRELIEHISDVLAQVAANTEGTKIAGCAVLYECIKTITSLNTEKSLRSLAVNLCGRFLSHKEPTVRYIALQELTRIVDADGPAVLDNVDGHKEKVLAGMREADPTVRKRAVELGYRIANESNIDEMVKELLGYVAKSVSHDAKEDACWKVFMLLERFGPSDDWKVETFVKTLSSADVCMPEEIITSFIAFVSAKPHVQGHAVRRLFSEAFAPLASGGGPHHGNDPFDSSRQATHDQQGDSGSSCSQIRRRKPRLERVALYLLGEHGEVTPQVGLDIPHVLDAFESMLCASETIDEPWMNTYESEHPTEKKILGEVALTGLVKFACRAISSSASGRSVRDPKLSLTGCDRGSGSDPLSSVLAITAPSKPKSDEQVLGLGTDILASMGLGEEKRKSLQNGTSHALVPAADLLASAGQGSAGALTSLESESNGSVDPVIARVRQILLPRAKNSELETQQRACEYLMLLNESLVPVLESTMAPMPPLDFKRIQESARQRKELRSAKSFSETSKGDGLLLDLLGDSGGSGPVPPALPAGDGDDLLALPPSAPRTSDMTLEDIMGDSASNAPPPRIPTQGQSLGFDLDALSGPSVTQSQTDSNELGEESEAGRALLSSTIFESDSLVVFARFFRDESVDHGTTRAELLFTNKSGFLMKNFVFLLAVPKYIKLEMKPASASEIPAGGQASQTVNLRNSLQGQKPIQLRYRVEYFVNVASGEHVREQGVAMGLEAL